MSQRLNWKIFTRTFDYSVAEEATKVVEAGRATSSAKIAVDISSMTTPSGMESPGGGGGGGLQEAGGGF
jgi:hypothetical protein